MKSRNAYKLYLHITFPINGLNVYMARYSIQLNLHNKNKTDDISALVSAYHTRESLDYVALSA